MKDLRSTRAPRAALLASLSAALIAALTIAPAHATEALQVESSALRSAQLNRQVMRDYGGHYRLEDGSVLRFSREGERVFASIANDARERRFEVRAVSANRFVAVHEPTEFRFVNNGSDRVTVSRAAVSQLAQATMPQSATEPAL
jgi:hypothetical protein